MTEQLPADVRDRAALAAAHAVDNFPPWGDYDLAWGDYRLARAKVVVVAVVSVVAPEIERPLRAENELLYRETRQLNETLGMARAEYGHKNLEDLDEYDRLRITANAFKAMNGVLELQVKRNKARVEELEAALDLATEILREERDALQARVAELEGENERLRRTSIVDNAYAGREIKVAFDDE